MNKILVILLASTLFFACNSVEKKEVKSHYDDFKKLHQNDKDVVTLSVPTFMTKMFVKSETKEVQDAISKINSLDFFIKENADDVFKSDLKKHISDKTYNTFLTFTEEDANIKVFTNEKDGIISELVILINKQKENTYVILKIGGEFDAKSIKKVTEEIDIEAIAKYK